MDYDTISKEYLIKNFAKMIQEGHAALFVGAGMSKGAGLVDWKELLKEPAEILGLSLERETDFPEIAEYFVHKMGNRGSFIQRIINDLGIPEKGNAFHKFLPDLPVKKIWTTNFDTLLEDSYRSAGKVCDVIKQDTDFVTSKPQSEVKIYKMHGDISNPAHIIITQDDYDTYESRYPTMLSKFYNDMAEESFLFLGFSFTDPNFDKVLSRIRSRFGNLLREHYTILREPEDDYEKNKLKHFIQNLKRYNIQAVVIQNYAEILDILRQIKKQYADVPEILISQIERDKFIVDQLAKLLEGPLDDIEIYNSAAFSSFAISDDKEYMAYEPVSSDEHSSLLLKEKEYLGRLMQGGKSFKLLLFPLDELKKEYKVRYQTLYTWLTQHKNQPSFDFRCNSLNFFKNMLIVKDKFCIISNYSQEKGYHENRIYFDRLNIDHFINDFNLQFATAKVCKSKAEAIAFYADILDCYEKYQSMEDTATIHSEILHHWYSKSLRKDIVKTADDEEVEYTYIEHPGSIIIIPLFSNGEVLLVDQYRYPIRMNSIEFPAGGINKGESPEAAANRELIEETGYSSADLSRLGEFYTSNSLTDERIEVYLARDLHETDTPAEGDEKFKIRIIKEHYSKLVNDIHDGHIKDGPTIIANQFLRDFLEK